MKYDLYIYFSYKHQFKVLIKCLTIICRSKLTFYDFTQKAQRFTYL